MAELLMINPRKRRTTRKRRTPAQRAATRKLVARNRSRTTTRRRRRNPIGAVRKRRVSTRRYRRNPTKMTLNGIMNTTMIPAAQAAAGALTLDIAWGYLPIPDSLKTGPMRYVAKGAGAIGLGMLAGMVVDKRMAQNFATGAMTVILHNAMREVAQTAIPNVPLDGMGYYSPGYPAGVGGYLNAYVDGQGQPYLASDMLTKPFSGPSAATVAKMSCLENENNMAACY